MLLELRHVDRIIREFHSREELKNFRPDASKSVLSENLGDIAFPKFIYCYGLALGQLSQYLAIIE